MRGLLPLPPPTLPAKCARPALATTSRSWSCNKGLKEFPGLRSRLLPRGQPSKFLSPSPTASLSLSVSSHISPNKTRSPWARGRAGKQASANHALSPIPRAGPLGHVSKHPKCSYLALVYSPGKGAIAPVLSFVPRFAPGPVPGSRDAIPVPPAGLALRPPVFSDAGKRQGSY
jgi:hypothetical protein